MEEVAKRLQVTKRTLRSWKLKTKTNCKKRSGRPSYTAQEERHALIVVARELHKQGYPGSPAIACALKNKVPLRLIRKYVGKINKRREKKRLSIRVKNRQTIKVKQANVIWTQDGTHLGRSCRKTFEAQVIKDRSSQKIISIHTGLSANAENVLIMFDELKKERELPLVWMTDNGSCYVNDRVKSYLREKKVIHLRSLPRVPEHNGSIERTMLEIKHSSLLGKNVNVSDKKKTHDELVQNVLKINENKKRKSLGFKTSNEKDEELVNNDSRPARDVFYNEYVDGLDQMRNDLSSKEKKVYERELIMCLLEKYGLIERIRGGKENVA